MSVPGRVADYDSVAARYDRRYGIHAYAGVKEALLNFIGEAKAVLEVGCGTGHWLAKIRSAQASRSREEPSASAPVAEREAVAGRLLVAGVEPSAGMIARARVAAPSARLVRGRAEQLPWGDATFDRVCCINALHHFADRRAFFAEARRVLKPGGGLMSIGKDPHADRDSWWVYDYFPETMPLDRDRFAPVRILRGELTQAGFSWAESFECDQIEALTPAAEALQNGLVDRAYTSQLTVLSDEDYASGIERIRAANEAAGGELQLVTGFRLFATFGWV